MNKKRKTKVIKILFAIELIGCFFLIINRVLYLNMDYTNCEIEIVGVVVKTEENISGNMSYFPVYEIEVEGKKYRHKRTFGSDKITWKIGDEIKIKYDLDNPNKMYCEEEKKWKNENAVSMLCGTIAILIMVLITNILALRKR